MDCWSMIDEMLNAARDVPPDPDRPAQGFVLVSNQASVAGVENVVGFARGFLSYSRRERTVQEGRAGLLESEALSGHGSQRFSDRKFTYGANNRETDFDPEHPDNIRVTITASLPRLVEVEIELLSWGNHRFRLSDLRCDAGVLSGVGEGVGPNIRHALYVLSVHEVGF
jgi:hypothetical protein